MDRQEVLNRSLKSIHDYLDNLSDDKWFKMQEEIVNNQDKPAPIDTLMIIQHLHKEHSEEKENET